MSVIDNRKTHQPSIVNYKTVHASNTVHHHFVSSASSLLFSQKATMTSTPTAFAAMVAGNGQNPTKAQISTPKLEENKALVKVSHAAQNPTDSTIFAPSTLAMTRR